MTAVLKHELKSYFHSMTAYVFGAGLLLAVRLGAMLYNIEAAVSNFEYALSYFSIIFAVIVPILTMRVIAEERKQKTDQLLYSLTISVVVLAILVVVNIFASALPAGLTKYDIIEENYHPTMPVALGLTVDEHSDRVTELLTTSGTAFSKLDGYSLSTYEKEDGDIDGPFALAASYDDLRHLEVLPAAFEDIRQADISLEGSRYTLTSEKDGKEQVWSYQGEELEIDSFRNALNALTADEFTTEKPSGKEEISLTLSLDRENAGEIQVQLHRYDGEHCIAVVDGESVCLVKRAAVVDLIEAVHAIVLD